MRVNIENCNNTGDPSAKEWVLGELVRNLKELRDRTDAGDIKGDIILGVPGDNFSRTHRRFCNGH